MILLSLFCFLDLLVKKKKPTRKSEFKRCASGKQVLWVLSRNTRNVPFLPPWSPTKPVWRIAVGQWGT